jgi:hypothetical protein
MHPFGPLGYMTLLGVMAVAAATSFAVPARWGWKAFPLVFLLLASVLLCADLAASMMLLGPAGGFVVHMNILQFVLAIVVFGLVRSVRRWRQKVH